MAKTRILLENFETEDGNEVTIRFPVEIRETKRITKQYCGIPSFSIEVYRDIQEIKYQQSVGGKTA